MLHILMSTYNGERYLPAQLDSILAQTYTDWRLIVRDDASTDATLTLLDEYAWRDKRITVVRDKQNIGACRSFERLMTQYGNADYFAFADQDDVWQPDKLERCMQVMRQTEAQYPARPVVVHSDLEVVDERLQPIASSFWRYTHTRPELLDSRIHYLAICNSVTGCAMLFNHVALEAALPMRKEAFMHDAWVALMTLYNGGRIIPIPQALVAYRQHEGNVLGATPYSAFGRGLKQRRKEAQVSYRRSQGLVYRNPVQFWCWKIIYCIHRTWRDLVK